MFRLLGRDVSRKQALVSTLTIACMAVALRIFMRVPLFQWQSDLLDDSNEIVAADAVLVLGYAVDHQKNEPMGPLVQRLQVALDLVCSRKIAKTIVLSGGRDPRLDPLWPTEADVMADWLRRNAASTGCNFSDVELILERNSTSTLTNAAKSLAILAGDSRYSSLRRIVLVTSRFHQYRTRRVFERVAQRDFAAQSFAFQLAEVPAPANGSVIQFDFWRELLAIALYRVMCWI